MIRQVLLSGILLLCLLVSFTTHTYPEISEKYIFYHIDPTTNKEIRTELLKYTPVTINGKKLPGHTCWHIHWSFNLLSEDNLCVTKKVKTNLEVEYTLPRLKKSTYNIAVEKTFNRYYQALLTHEKGHMKNSILAAREIQKTISLLTYKGNCNKLEYLANIKAKNIIKKYNQLDIQYDHETWHGLNQGAYLIM